MSGNTKSTSSFSDEDVELRRGSWSVEEDNLLIHYIDRHGEGRWNLLANRSGLRRTGKSCRLRWMNYLKPDVKRGNLTPHEQLSILELHSKWGNRWSKIAQHLPGRTDNEIKNYWRTRVQKQARYLNIDSNSNAFQEVVRRLWIPRLLQKIQASNAQNSSTIQTLNLELPAPLQMRDVIPFSNLENNQKNSSSENCSSSSISSSDELMHIAQISEHPTSPYNDLGNNIDYNTFLKGFCSVENNNMFDKEPFSLQQTTLGMGDFGVPIGDLETVENNWNDEIANGLWNMDKLW